MTGIKHMTVVVLAVGLAVASAGMAMAGQQRPYPGNDQRLSSRYRLTGTMMSVSVGR